MPRTEWQWGSQNRSEARTLLLTPQRGRLRQGVTSVGGSQVNMFLSPLGLSTEHVVLSGKQPETCERVWSMPRTNIQAAFCSDRDIVWCWAAMSLFSPLAFHSSCAHCSSTLLNCWFSLELLLEAAVPLDNYSLAIRGNMSIGSCYFHLICVSGTQTVELWGAAKRDQSLISCSPTPPLPQLGKSEQPQPPLPLCCSWGKEEEGYLEFS